MSRTYDLNGFSIGFNNDDNSPQIIEINVPVPNNDYQPADNHHLIVESEETIEYDGEAENEGAHNYPDNFDHNDHDVINKFPIKIVNSTLSLKKPLSIGDIIRRMDEQVINSSWDASAESAEAATKTATTPTESVAASTDIVDEPEQSMVVDEMLPSELSSLSVDDENEDGTESDPNQTLGEDDFTDAQTHGTSPTFFNSSNSRQVLMLLKTKVYFHGALSIRLLAGQANVFGYELQRNKTVIANSPRGHSFLYLSPSTQHHTENDANLNLHLKELCEAFVSSDLEQIMTNFDGSTDAIVLLENDASNKSIFMIEKYMKQAVFPNVNTFNNRRTFLHTESILRCQFFQRTKTGLTINNQWEDIVMTSISRQIIIGGKGVGKSTLVRYLINKNLKEFKKILLIDLDIGQPEMFVPQTVSATVITEPILGPGYLQNESPYKSYLFGDVNVLASPIKYLKCVLKLLKHCSTCEEFKTMPWVINTMGYNRGFGLELIVGILRALNPTDLIQIQARRSIDNFEKILNTDEVNDFCFNIFKDEVQDMQSDCSYSTYICNTMSKGEQKKAWDISPKDLRFAMILSKLGNILQGNANWITDVRPVW